MSKRTHLIAFLTLIAVAPSACQTGPYDTEVSSRQFQDVVVPDDFRLDDRNRASYSTEVADTRNGHFVYLGTPMVADAAEYVQGRMPHHGWRLVDQQKGEGPEDSMKLVYERGIYSAVYDFTRQDGVTRMVVDYTTDYSKL